MRTGGYRGWTRLLGVIALLVSMGVALPAAAGRTAAATAGATAAPRISAVRSGAIPTHDGLQLTLSADTGNVRVFTDASGEVRYQVRVEAEKSNPAAAGLLKQFSLQAHSTPNGVALTGRMPKPGDFERVWVSYEVHLPRRYGLAITTQAGDIVTQDIDGQVALTTGGGNIHAGRMGGARLETGGGHILVGDVSGGLHASTAGGHITAGNVGGDAVLHTDGGHIRVGKVGGSAQLTTGGGNITVARADSGAVAETTGGRIEFAEAAGAIHARTGGGGIHIAHVAGPTELDSSDGGVFLAGVAAPLHASTATGAITAWFSPQFKGAAGSELASGQGDIVVYLPRDIAVTIDAQIAQGSDHRIVADPSLPLKVRYQESAAGHGVHAQAALNGGGELLHLKTGTGNIHLRYLDAGTERQLVAQQEAVAEQGLAAEKALLLEMERQTAAAFEDDSQGRPADVQVATATDAPSAASAGGMNGFARLFEGFWWGGVRVDPGEQQKRLEHAVRPEYPEAARQADLEGNVTLRLVIGPDGAVKDIRTISGDPELARSAVEAVAQWVYAPALLDGKPVSVVTTVTLAFRLQ